MCRVIPIGNSTSLIGNSQKWPSKGEDISSGIGQGIGCLRASIALSQALSRNCWVVGDIVCWWRGQTHEGNKTMVCWGSRSRAGSIEVDYQTGLQQLVTRVFIQVWCGYHDCDWTHPYSPYPDLSMLVPSHQNHPWAPLAKPKPSGSILSQLASNTFLNPLIPLHLDNTFSTLYPFPTQPNPMLLWPFLFLTSVWFPTPTLIPNLTPFDLLSLVSKSTPNVSSVSRLWSGEAQLCTSLAQCILVCLFPPSIYLYVLYVSSFATLHLFLCLILSSPPPLTLVWFIFILSLHWPSLVIPYFPYNPFPIITTPRTCINTLSTSCCNSVW